MTREHPLPVSESPLVSVVIPCLNRARYLRATVESILSQAYPRIECIVMDGGSTDDTLELLRGYAGRLEWHSGEDRGQADAINKGWERARGEIVTWLNADDLWAPGAVEKAVRCFRDRPEIDVLYGDHRQIDAEGREGRIVRAFPFTLEDLVVRSVFAITQPASFLRRRVLDHVGMLDIGFPSLFDYEYWSRIGLHAAVGGQAPFFYLPEILAYARTTSDYRGEDRARECVRIIRRALAHPSLPAAIRAQHARAMSHAWIRASWYMRGARTWRTLRVALCLFRAFLTDPTNRSTIRQEFFSYMRFASMRA